MNEFKGIRGRWSFTAVKRELFFGDDSNYISIHTEGFDFKGDDINENETSICGIYGILSDILKSRQMNKQDEILKYLRTVPQATLSEIYDNVPFGYYCNELKHLGEILSRMVKKGNVTRVKKGVFSHANKTEKVKSTNIGGLFE